MFLNTACSVLRATGFSCSFGGLYQGLWISKFEFLIKKIKVKFPAIIRIRNENKCLIGIRIRIRIKRIRIGNQDFLGKKTQNMSTSNLAVLLHYLCVTGGGLID
jgi:hypothetical protein